MLLHLDPSIASDNLGDRIISKYVDKELAQSFPKHEIIKVPTQLFGQSRRLARLVGSADGIFIGGSNLLSGRYPRIHQWANMHQYLINKDNIFSFGVGWHSYEGRINLLSRLMLKRILHPEINSVRDEYTRAKLKEVNIQSINTGCPTLWGLKSVYLKDDCKNLVFTLTYYRANILRDNKFLEDLFALASRYNLKVKFWPQSNKDLAYLNEVLGNITHSELKILDPTIMAFEEAMAEGIYIGTRLHAGIHALNLARPAFISKLDNRAVEMHRSFNIPVFDSVNEISLKSGALVFADFCRKKADAYVNLIQGAI